MRLKVGEGTAWKEHSVYLDGVKLERCTEADDQEGWARCDVGIGVIDADGNPIEETKHGKVEFRSAPLIHAEDIDSDGFTGTEIKAESVHL